MKIHKKVNQNLKKNLVNIVLDLKKNIFKKKETNKILIPMLKNLFVYKNL